MLHQILTKAFAAAQKLAAQRLATESAQPLAQMQKQRSKDWVDELASAFRQEYARSAQYRVFSREHPMAASFGLAELSFDISVCKIARIKSAELDNEVEYVTEPVWQIETSFSNDAKDAVADFNKLVVGGASNRLFVGPIIHSPAYLRTLAVPAKGCKDAAVWLAMVPHPSRWPTNAEGIRLFKFDGKKWQPQSADETTTAVPQSAPPNN